MSEHIDTATSIGALAFGVVIGWNLYLINRYRSGTVQLQDLVTLIGALGGGAVLTLFKPATSLFGYYGIGLAAGFFLYFAVLLLMVRFSGGKFTVTWFLDGRRKKPADDEVIPPGTATTIHPLEANGPVPR